MEQLVPSLALAPSSLAFRLPVRGAWPPKAKRRYQPLPLELRARSPHARRLTGARRAMDRDWRPIGGRPLTRSRGGIGRREAGGGSRRMKAGGGHQLNLQESPLPLGAGASSRVLSGRLTHELRQLSTGAASSWRALTGKKVGVSPGPITKTNEIIQFRLPKQSPSIWFSLCVEPANLIDFMAPTRDPWRRAGAGSPHKLAALSRQLNSIGISSTHSSATRRPAFN